MAIFRFFYLFFFLGFISCRGFRSYRKAASNYSIELNSDHQSLSCVYMLPDSAYNAYAQRHGSTWGDSYFNRFYIFYENGFVGFVDIHKSKNLNILLNASKEKKLIGYKLMRYSIHQDTVRIESINQGMPGIPLINYHFSKDEFILKDNTLIDYWGSDSIKMVFYKMDNLTSDNIDIESFDNYDWEMEISK